MGMMLFRLVLSLGFVAVVLWFAARVAKKRGLGGRQGLIEVLARQPMGRTSAVTVIRVADKVMVVGSTEGQITLLGDMDTEAVEEHIARLDADEAMNKPVRASTPRAASTAGTGLVAGSVFDRSQWSALIDGLRERTVRR
jgi:flagellar protein FliO/FliZ